MTLVFGLEGHWRQEGCKVAANILYGFDCLTDFSPEIKVLNCSVYQRDPMVVVVQYKREKRER